MEAVDQGCEGDNVVIGRIGVDGTSLFHGTEVECFTFSLGNGDLAMRSDCCHLLGVYMGKTQPLQGETINGRIVPHFGRI